MIALILILFVALLLPGIIARTRAVLAGRKGVTLDQHLKGFVAHLQKEPIYSPVTSYITRWTPVVVLASTITALLMVPVGPFGGLLSFEGDVVLFCYLLALGRFCYILAALDAGSSFQGMGASREALYGALIEPALFLVLGTLSLISGYTSFSMLFSGYNGALAEALLVAILLFYVIFRILLVEAGRVPLDDPKTHLELTMIHEVMILDYSGFDMALISLSGWLRNAMLAVIAAAALVSVALESALLVVLIALGCGVLIGVLESFMARHRLSHNPLQIIILSAVMLLVVVLVFLLSLETLDWIK